MSHLPEMLAEFDHGTQQILKTQLSSESDRRFGAFVLDCYHVDTRGCGLAIAHLIISYVAKESRYYVSDEVKTALENGFAFIMGNLRPSGCVDLSSCNFDSAPDTAFTANELINAWWLLEKRMCDELAWLKAPLMQLLVTLAQGISDGGFHTPNHRWVIASCLKCVARIANRPDFDKRADEYLNEGLDINSDGEFAERSAGNYNQVNDEQMLRLYIATGDKSYLEAARKNLQMMLTYIDPDDSVFTNNSRRQDNGNKVYLDSYYILFLLTGYFIRDEQLAAMARYCYQTSYTARRIKHAPNGLPWLLLMEELEAFEENAPTLNTEAFTHYDRHFATSKIARMRDGSLSLTVMEDKPNFLYVRNGSMSMYMVIHAQVCGVCNFLPDSIEKIENGYRLSSHVDGWYYLPFYPEKPETSDWWAMDNANTRKKMINVSLDISVEAKMQDGHADISLKAEGYSGIPLRVELGFLPCDIRHSCFEMHGAPGGSIILNSGMLEMKGSEGDILTIKEGFAEHGYIRRRDTAYPQSNEHFTVYLTAYTPTEKTIRIDTRGFEKQDLLN